MKLQPLEPADLHVGRRIAVSTPFDARLWVRSPDGDFILSPMSGLGETDSHYWAEVQRLDLPYEVLMREICFYLQAGAHSTANAFTASSAGRVRGSLAARPRSSSPGRGPTRRRGGSAFPRDASCI